MVELTELRIERLERTLGAIAAVLLFHLDEISSVDDEVSYDKAIDDLQGYLLALSERMPSLFSKPGDGLVNACIALIRARNSGADTEDQLDALEAALGRGGISIGSGEDDFNQVRYVPRLDAGAPAPDLEQDA